MKVQWLGHAAFLITAKNGKRILCDPYAAASGLKYGEIGEAADVVTVSHHHFDHDNAGAVKGNPQVISSPGSHQAAGFGIKGIPTHHDTSSGRERGDNIIFCFTVDGVRVCHLGDLGHPLSDQQVAEMGAVDVLLVPVGGTYTLDAAGATALAQRLKPRVAIPMHFKTARCDLPISGVEDFLKGRADVVRAEGSEVDLSKDRLPAATRTIVLRHAL